MNLADAWKAYEKFEDGKRADGLSDQTLRSYQKCIRGLLEWLGLKKKEMTTETIKEFMQHKLDEKLKPSSMQLYKTTLKMWCGFNKMDFLPIKTPTVRWGMPKFLRPEQTKAMYAACRTLREKAMFSTCYSCAMRFEELSTRRMQDFEFLEDIKKARLLVQGKTGPETDAYEPLTPTSVKDLRAYLDSLPVKLKPSDYVFFQETDPSKPMPSSTGRDIFYGIMERAGVSRGSGAWHRLRHTRATDLMNTDTPVTTVQVICRHKDIKTTLRYAKTSAETARRQTQGKDVLEAK